MFIWFVILQFLTPVDMSRHKTTPSTDENQTLYITYPPAVNVR